LLSKAQTALKNERKPESHRRYIGHNGIDKDVAANSKNVCRVHGFELFLYRVGF